jgi:transposase
MQVPPTFVGVDVAKAELVVAIDGQDNCLNVANECAAIVNWLRTLLQSIVGVGPQTSTLLASLLMRLSFASSDALVAYSGLDPRANDSGPSRGRHRLSKRGSPALRRQMFMAAMAACHTSTFAPTYQALRARGLKKTEALVILACKLLRIAFAVWRSGQPFEAQRITQSA